ncbi:Cell wall-associated hydrolase, NlpC family [Streptomyces sp. TLI_053]|uniref:C40 family peptidase n=1 Tax=Streptomyces sp. TLI_053 TaxID=1855352 RepID=UPI00087BD149|nr:C40 family peptidase [Streptomyces sp. TLI_053]SDT73270.1 Cell wall-associated hydrolase, NlpC family [Streptomyces sp. TLI_053]
MARGFLPTLLLSLTALLGLLPAAAAAPVEPGGASTAAEPPGGGVPAGPGSAGGPGSADGPGSAGAPAEQAYPSAEEIDRSRAEADATAGSVAVIEAGLTAARAELDTAARTAEQAVEAHNGAQLALTRARAEESAAADRSAAAEAERSAAAEDAAALAAETYRQGTSAELSAINALLGARGPREAGDRAAVVGVASDRSRQILDAAVSTAAGAARAVAAARTAAEAAERAAAAVGAARERAEARLTDQQNQVAATGLKRERLLAELAAARHTTVELERQRREALEAIAAREAEAAARAAAEKAAAEREAAERAAAELAAAEKAAAERAAAAAAAASAAAASPAKTGPAAAAPPAGRPWSAENAASAVAFARARIGLPYIWGGEGPVGYDCSGLTMMAWREGGKRLNHFAADQYAQSTPVTYRQLRPGDLVFWSATGRAADIHHVGLYIGDDQMIEAPRAGMPIKQASLWIMGTPDFYARP